MVDYIALKYCASELPNQLKCLDRFVSNKGLFESFQTTSAILPAPAALTALIVQRPGDTLGKAVPAPTPATDFPKRISHPRLQNRRGRVEEQDATWLKRLISTKKT